MSNFRTDPIDLRADNWLGLHSSTPASRRTGLWNINHVDGAYDPTFLYTFGEQIAKTALV